MSKAPLKRAAGLIDGAFHCHPSGDAGDSTGAAAACASAGISEYHPPLQIIERDHVKRTRCDTIIESGNLSGV